jgi:hypothetical protein
MKRKAALAVSGLVLLVLAACGGKPEAQDGKPEAQGKEAAAKALGRDTDKTVFDDMIQTEDKARAVEGVTLGHKADMDAAIENAEGDSKDKQE